MRICSGKYKGRALHAPTGDHVRPTSDKVRQAVFNMLESRGYVHDMNVLDGFCGTGALGLEALSRGAQFCVFLDKDSRALQTCKRNIETLGATDQCVALCRDTLLVGGKPDSLPLSMLVFLDPPYAQDLIPKAIHAVHDGGWVHDDAVYVIESEKQYQLTLPSFSVLQEKTYKDTKIMIIKKRT